jgi:NADH dehydrogenase
MAEVLRVTVFGGSGFIGRHLVQRLVRQGDMVTVVARHDAPFLKPMGDVGQVVQQLGNLADTGLLQRAVAGADAVVNLIGILAESGGQRFDAVQHLGAERIARAAAAAGVARFVQISAIGADPASPSRYARSKARGEAAVLAAFPAATILRPSIVFGPEDLFFNRFAAMAETWGVLPLIGGGATRFQPVYVGDVADAVRQVLGRPDTAGRIYELGGPEIRTFRALLELMLRVIGRPKTRLVPLPFAVAGILALFAQYAPGAPLTPDQVVLLRVDNVVGHAALALRDLGLAPTAMAQILPGYLSRKR